MKIVENLRWLLLAFTLVLLACLGYKTGRVDQPRETWSSNGILAGEDLALFNSGKYKRLEWGDLPPYEPTYGIWRRQDGRLYLVPDTKTERIEVFQILHKFNCQFLRNVRARNPPLDLFPSGVTSLDMTLGGDSCRSRAEAFNRAHRR
jgi:hypothetical protein